MLDRYLSRGKVKNGERKGEWVVGSYIPKVKIRDTGIHVSAMWLCDDIEGSGFVEIDPGTVGRCTGAKDKNGQLTFEGDIAGYEIENMKDVGIVTWWQGGWTVKSIDNSFEDCIIFCEEEAKHWEIIGNVHDDITLPEVHNE